MTLSNCSLVPLLWVLPPNTWTLPLKIIWMQIRKWHGFKKTHEKPKGFGKTTHEYVKPQRLMENNTAKHLPNPDQQQCIFSLTVCIAKVWQWSGHNMVTTTMVWPWLSKTDVGHGMAMAIVQWPFTSSWPLACWSSWLSWPSWPSLPS